MTGCTGRSWGFVAPDVQDPPQCIALCRERFLKELLPEDETFDRVCEALQDSDRMERDQPFQALYCCDAQACGVDNLGERGRDPNVNWLINACQDIGYHSVIDPGPPQPYHICDSESFNGNDKHCQDANSTDKTQYESSTTASRPPSTKSTTTTENTVSTKPTTKETISSVPLQSSVPQTSYSTSRDPSTKVTSDPSNSDQNGTKDNKGMPLGVKVTIAIISVVSLLAIGALIFCLLRRRRSRKNDIRRLIKHPTSPPPVADSPTPLVSPTISFSVSHVDAEAVPLTPPARLRERRYLPTTGDQPEVFPTSPLFSPTGRKLSPRHERTPRIYSANQVPMIIMTAPDGGNMRDNDHSASISDGIITPPPFALIDPFGISGDTSPPHPPHPPRSRDASFNMLASPGPPPTRALPSTPPNRPATPTNPPQKGMS
ncbi:hypothetical protein FVEN_g6287 [Fusarium venenatum]|uniref:Extracellular membrane protein CFEM domain-containing protein n=1 Tax=Fusarium venenatum TaxID=56646 RepID=A0A2L2T3H2_9HYPO|nr:uncharacterized protein FVRRES_01796 [Fusarium venenatum]KAG8355911.1 hypothetical protein FVEN_g6287 [Fusarium venenatum]CEI65284.1 unnamed protein product [Fusarium venenatum]